MVLNLPSPDRHQLARSPLVLTVCQVRFEQILAVADARVMLGVQEALGGPTGLYPRVDQIKGPSLQVLVSAEGGQESRPLQGVAGWRLQSDDGAWTASVMPDFVALETTRYTTWEADFGPRMSSLLDAVAAHVNPALEERLGLRYVDRLTGLAIREPAHWTRYIAAPLLGVLLHETLGSAVVSTQQQIDLNLGGDVRCILRHGHPTEVDDEGLQTYVLDFDVYRQSARRFDVEGIKDALALFSDAALQLFHESLNRDYLTWLKEADRASEATGRAAQA
jgi:uncharacterized protein (TIGR04255 family)